jgi:hypothetical protein
MTDDKNGRMQAAREAMTMTPEELVTWAGERTANDGFRQPMVTLEFERRVTVAAQETAAYTKASARYMLWSVIVLAASAVITAAATVFSAWWVSSQSTPPGL